MSDQTLSNFTFENTSIRVYGNSTNPLFVAKDICDALGIQNVTQALQTLAPVERSMLNIGRQGEVNMVTESGLYTLIFRCREAVKEGTFAYRFRLWVTSEVLPSIRQTGSYSLTSSSFNPPALLEQALHSGADPEKTASQLMTAAAMLQMMARLKEISETASPSDIQRAMLAFENELDAETKAKRERISAMRRQAVLSRYNKGE